jgi:hypothetical protein
MHPSDKDYYYHATLIDNGSFKIGSKISDFSDYANPRYATEEEKQKLFDKIEAEGYEWNPDERKLVRKKWKPIKYEMFYCPILNTTTFGVYATGWEGYNSELELLNKGWIFQTEEECQSFCDKLNQTINQIKP